MAEFPGTWCFGGFSWLEVVSRIWLDLGFDLLLVVLLNLTIRVLLRLDVLFV